MWVISSLIIVTLLDIFDINSANLFITHKSIFLQCFPLAFYTQCLQFLSCHYRCFRHFVYHIIFWNTITFLFFCFVRPLDPAVSEPVPELAPLSFCCWRFDLEPVWPLQAFFCGSVTRFISLTRIRRTFSHNGSPGFCNHLPVCILRWIPIPFCIYSKILFWKF